MHTFKRRAVKGTDMKKKILCLLLALSMTAVSLCGCGPKENVPKGETVSVTDCAGRTVDVPKDPQSICCVCPFSGSLVVMFGLGDRMTTTCNNVWRSNLLKAICPSVADMTVVKNNGSLNAEAVMSLKTDLIIINDGMYASEDERKKLDSLGIPYVVIGFTDIESQLDAIEILGKVLGSEEEAGEYIDWCRNTYSEVRTALSASLGPKISLYHAVNEATRTDYDGSICAEWIAMTGVRNVSLGSELKLEGEKAYTTLEQIYSWDPDMIICNEPGVDDYILSDPKWAGLRCVREAKVYQIPVGVARMGHPTSTETPLALMWLAELLYPELYDIDYVQVLKDYYHRFYDYDISDDTAEAIIEGDEMRAAKPSGSVE